MDPWLVFLLGCFSDGGAVLIAHDDEGPWIITGQQSSLVMVQVGQRQLSGDDSQRAWTLRGTLWNVGTLR